MCILFNLFNIIYDIMATYARAFDNFVSFGANLPGQKDMCHQTDEFISIDNLITAYEIYCRAIKELLIM